MTATCIYWCALSEGCESIVSSEAVLALLYGTELCHVNRTELVVLCVVLFSTVVSYLTV